MATSKATTDKKTSAGKKPARKKSTGTRKTSRSRTAQKTAPNARNLFLAGLGAYCKVIDDAQCQLKENRDKANELFGEWVKRGEQAETTARKKLQDIELPEIRVAGINIKSPDELREELQARLDRARDSFNTLRDAVSLKSGPN